ncbi:MAG: DinB family protein [Acidobacteriota bacterium]
MDRQLVAVIEDLQAADRRLQALRAALPLDAWCVRPATTSWSPAECVAHLNLTSEALLPRLRAGLAEAGDVVGRAASRYRRGLVGWLIWRTVAPTGRLRTRTLPAFVPQGDRPAEEVLEDFGRLQSDVIACVRAADGLPIDLIKVVSPFDARVRYNLFAALTIVPRHQHRHLLQAERAAGVVGPAAALAV